MTWALIMSCFYAQAQRKSRTANNLEDRKYLTLQIRKIAKELLSPFMDRDIDLVPSWNTDTIFIHIDTGPGTEQEEKRFLEDIGALFVRKIGLEVLPEFPQFRCFDLSLQTEGRKQVHLLFRFVGINTAEYFSLRTNQRIRMSFHPDRPSIERDPVY